MICQKGETCLDRANVQLAKDGTAYFGAERAPPVGGLRRACGE